MKKVSLYAYLIGAFALCYSSLVYYPKWKVGQGECVLTWDVSGYYFYLPAIFIYKDLKKIEFKDKILSEYNPTPELQQAFLHKESGNYVMKYSCGQAIQYLPAFLVGHLYAKNSHFEDDGFSKPYQVAMVFWSLAIGLLGFWFARKNLLHYFDDETTAITLLLLVFGTNYLNYAAIDGAMSHNWCFTLLAILIFATYRFYETAAWKYAIAIGICVGWAALTRPTEILVALIPLFWGVFNADSFKERIAFLRKHYLKIATAVLLTLLVGSIQLFYWKYITGHWIVYSYEDQGFSWLHPHLKEGLLSYRAGWLPYTPLMVFGLLGFVPLFQKQRAIAWISMIYVVLFIYIAFAWDVWWYGGSLGQRTMVQSYAIQIFPLAAFVSWIFDWTKSNSIIKKNLLTFAAIGAMSFFTYINIWLTHQAHKGGFFVTGEMNKQYYWAILGKWKPDVNYLKLLDTDEYFHGTPTQLNTLYFNDFELDTLAVKDGSKPNNKILFFDEWNQKSTVFKVSNQGIKGKWLRMSCEYHFTKREWDTWKIPQLIISFTKDGKALKTKTIRTHRLFGDGQNKTIFFDTKIPSEPYDTIEMSYWNGGSKTTNYIDNMKLESFE